MGDQGVDEGRVRVARRGVDHQAGGFVDHQQVRVLVDDVERDVLRPRNGGRSLRDKNGKSLAGFDPVWRVLYRLAVGADPAVFDEGLDPCPR